MSGKKHNLLERLRRVSGKVKSEYDYLNQRLNWLILFQGFLINAFVLTVKAENNLFLAGISFVGFVLTLIIWLAILGGVHFIERDLKPKRQSLEREVESLYKYEKLGADIGTSWHVLGLLPLRLIPLLFVLFWAFGFMYSVFGVFPESLSWLASDL